MPAELTYLLESLQDPNKSSSIIPLIITLFFLVLISVISLVILVSAIRIFAPTMRFPRFRIPRVLSPWGKLGKRRKRKKASDSKDKILYHDMPVTDDSELDRLRRENAELRADNSNLMIRISGQDTQVEGLEKQNKESQQILTQAHFKVVELQKHGMHLEKMLKEVCFEVEQLYMTESSSGKDMRSIGGKLEHLLHEANLQTAMGNAIRMSDAPHVIAAQAKEIEQLKELLLAARQQMVELSQQSQKNKS